MFISRGTFMKKTKYPNLTKKERACLYNKQFRDRKKNDPKYQIQLQAYRREHLKKDYNKMKQNNLEKYKIEMKKHTVYARNSRLRDIEKGITQKFRQMSPKKYFLNAAKCRAKKNIWNFQLPKMILICPNFVLY